VRQVYRILLITLAIQLSAVTGAEGATLSTDCRWNESSVEWILARTLPEVNVAGSLGSVLLPFLHRQGIPISFISRPSEDVDIQLDMDAATTVQKVLDEVVRQQAGYRYGVIMGRVVIYPTGEEFDRPLEINRLGGTRAQVMYSLLKDLKKKYGSFKDLELPALRGGGGKNLYGDRVEIGGAHSIVEHLASLTGERPAVAFRVLAREGRLSFALDWVPLVKKVEVHVPPSVKVGSMFVAKVTGTLVDGSVMSLGGPECGVEYEVLTSDVLEMNEPGQILARRAGVGTLSVQYEGHFAQANIRVLQTQGGGVE
jgi:hypothetical protein